MRLQFVLRQEVMLGRAVIDIEDIGFCFAGLGSDHFGVFGMPLPLLRFELVCPCFSLHARKYFAREALFHGSLPLPLNCTSCIVL